MDERWQIREAVLDLVFEHGCDGTSEEMILERSGVDASAFEREFGSRENCFLVIYLESNERFVREVFGAFESGRSWREGLRAAAYVAARFLRDRPREVRLNVLQVFRVGEMALAERDRYHQLLVDLIDAGSYELDDPDAVPRSVAEGVVGSIVESMARQVGKEGSAANAEAAVPELMYVAVRPYLGHEAALEELRIQAPPEPGNRYEPETDTVMQEGGEPRYRAAVPQREPSGEKTPPGLSRLPPGRHGLSREFVTKNQRDRITAGMIATVAEHGYHAATISQIAEAAGVSRRTFYTYFSGKEECFTATYQLIADHLEEAGRAAAAEETEWPAQVRARLAAALAAFAANPDLVTYTMIAPQVAGGEPADFYRGELERALAILTEGMPSDAREPSPAAVEGLIGAMAGLVVREVRAGRGDRLPELVPDLLELILALYLGREEAARVARGLDG